LRITQPIGEIVRLFAPDQTPKALEQLISGGEAFIVIQHVLQGLTLMLIKLVWWT
jgi:hypothetical protein